MTVLVTTSPSFGLHGRVPVALRERGWELVRCVEAERLAPHLARADFLVVGLVPVGAQTLAAAPRLRGVLKHGVGVDNIDIAACTARNLPVLNTPGANANAVAELALATLFCLSRDLIGLHAGMLSKSWERPVGGEIEGKTLGVVGLGNIGRILARKAVALGMRVLAFDLYPDRAFAARENVELVDLQTLLREADAVSLHVAGGGGALIGARELASMKPGAYLLNMARGDVVDLDALDAALADGRLGGAALDAFPTEPPDWSHPVFSRKAVVLTPHVGASTAESVERVGLMNIEDIDTLLAGGRPARTLNPEVFGG